MAPARHLENVIFPVPWFWIRVDSASNRQLGWINVSLSVASYFARGRFAVGVGGTTGKRVGEPSL